MPAAPNIIVIAGPNGAGKSTIAHDLLVDALQLHEFVNADTIAAGLAAFNPESAAFAAGRVMLARLHELATAQSNFAFESTLSSRTFAPWLRRQVASGYQLRIVYLMLKSPQLAARRVSKRVREGGHHIPSETVRRRFFRSASNLLTLYLRLAHDWRIYENSSSVPLLVASGGRELPDTVCSPALWKHLHAAAAEKAR